MANKCVSRGSSCSTSNRGPVWKSFHAFSSGEDSKNRSYCYYASLIMWFAFGQRYTRLACILVAYVGAKRCLAARANERRRHFGGLRFETKPFVCPRPNVAFSIRACTCCTLAGVDAHTLLVPEHSARTKPRYIKVKVRLCRRWLGRAECFSPHDKCFPFLDTRSLPGEQRVPLRLVRLAVGTYEDRAERDFWLSGKTSIHGKLCFCRP